MGERGRRNEGGHLREGWRGGEREKGKRDRGSKGDRPMHAAAHEVVHHIIPLCDLCHSPPPPSSSLQIHRHNHHRLCKGCSQCHAESRRKPPMGPLVLPSLNPPVLPTCSTLPDLFNKEMFHQISMRQNHTLLKISSTIFALSCARTVLKPKCVFSPSSFCELKLLLIFAKACEDGKGKRGGWTGWEARPSPASKGTRRAEEVKRVLMVCDGNKHQSGRLKDAAFRESIDSHTERDGVEGSLRLD